MYLLAAIVVALIGLGEQLTRDYLSQDPKHQYYKRRPGESFGRERWKSATMHKDMETCSGLPGFIVEKKPNRLYKNARKCQIIISQKRQINARFMKVKPRRKGAKTKLTNGNENLEFG